MEITIKLYGNLRKFGSEYKLKDVANVADALQALYCQIGGFRMAIQRGLFEIKLNEKIFSMETLKDDVLNTVFEKAILHIVPVFAGSGGAVQTIVGAVLVVVGAVFQQYYLVGMGVALMASGVATMLTRIPDTNTGGMDEKDKIQSTSFSNLQNLVAQGRPVPLAVGRIMVGSLIIGKGLETEKVNLIEPPSKNRNGSFGLKRKKR